MFTQLDDRIYQCSYSPLYRHRHQCEQAEGGGWRSRNPGLLVWDTPSGRSYTTTPSSYHG